jgi:hypothetical protein
MTAYNEAEAEAREHKAHKLADVLYDQCELADASDADVALLSNCYQEFRDQVARAAGKDTVSDVTWKRTVAIVLHRRDAVRMLRAAIQKSFDDVKERQVKG